MKRKMRRLLAMLLAFTLTFTVASTDVLAAGLEMAGEESVATNEIAEFAEAEGADTGEEVIAGMEDSAGIDGENIAGAKATVDADGEDLDGAKATATADGENLDGAKATVDADGGDLDGAKATVDADGEGIADAKDAAGAVGEDLVGASADDADGAGADADEADAGADDEGGADAVADDADGADADADVVNEEDGAETEDAAEAEDAAEMAEGEDETLAEVGGSPRLRSFGAPRSLSLSNTEFSEGFEGDGIPEGWTVIADDEENQWFVGMDENYGIIAYSGDQMAIMQSFNSNRNGTSWLISPSLDLSGEGKDWLLSFWYRNPAYSGLRYSLETYYRVNGGEWKVLSQISTAHDDWAEEDILLPQEAKTTNVEIGFKAVEEFSYGVYLDDFVLQRPTTDYYRISVSDAMIGGSVNADKSYAVAGETITVNVTPDGFFEFKTLTVKKGSTAIATTKVDETTYTFVMPEGNVTVEATFQRMKGIVFYEDFEDGGELPGWIFTDADGDGNNWFIYAIEAALDANGNDVAHSGSHVLTSASYENNNGLLTPDNWAMTPVITLPANAQLSFWIRGQDPNYPNEKMAVYVGTGTSVEGMTKVGGDYTATDVLENYVVDLGAYAGQSIRIAFRHYNVADLYRLNLDDVFVTGRSGDATIGTLTYNANGGSGETTDSKNPYILGRMATVLPCGFTAPAGMEFMGWNTEADGSGTTYAPGDAILMDGDKTLYATWVNPADLIAYLEEGFESGAIPEGWSLENEDDGYSWAINQRGTRVGNYSANANWSSVETKGKSSWLITPAINLSGVKGPACLSFMLVNDDYYGKVDEFGVYYRIGGGAWQVLFYTSEAHDGYGMDPEIYLPNEVKVANVQFAFRAIDRSGKGVSLDEVLLTGVKEVKAYYAVTYNANGGSGETVDLSSPYQKNDTATVMPNLFTAPEGKKFDSWNTKADGTGTTYYPAQTFTVTGAVTLYARWQDVSPMPTELDEGFEGGVIPEEWTMESDSESYRWTVGTGDYQLTPGAHSGGKNALIRHATNDSTAWLITPALDLRGEKDCLLSFWYLNRKWGTDTDAFKVCYRVAGGAWTELFYTQEPHGTWTEKILRVPKEARAKGVEFGFWALDKYGRGVGLDDVQVKVYDHPVSLLTIEDSTNGTMTADATGIRNAGDAVTLTVTPNEGYQLAEIQMKDGSECPAIKKDTSVKYLFTMPEGDVTMEAKFYAEGATYSYNLYVGGSQITTDNDIDVLGNGEVSYDGITKVLTFKKDVTHTYGDAVSSNINGLIIKTITEVTITSGADDAMQLNGQTVIETGNLLTLKGAADKGGYGIYARANVTIRNSKMNVFGKWGLYSSSGKVITIENSVVTAQGPYGAVNGIDLVDCDVVAPVGGTFSEGGLIRESSWSIAEKATVSPVIEVTADNPFFEGFEGHSIPRDWTFIDADGDGRGWSRYSVGNAVLHSGDVALTSYSYLEYVDQPLTPDNWAYLPALKIPEHAELSFWLAAQSEIWAGDVLGVFVGTTLNPEDMTQLGEDFVSTAECVEHKLDLSAYAGQTIFIAFRHYNCTDHYQLNLDDVKVSVGKLTDDNLVISKKSLTLYDTISIEFKVPETAFAGYHDPYLEATQNGKTSRIYEYRTEGGLRIFTYRVAPHVMGDAVTAVPHALNADGVDVTGVAMTYSVTEYCYNQLGKDTYQTEQWAPFRRLLVDILLYGDAAQKFTGYKTTELPSWKLTSAQRAMGTDVTVPMVYNNVKDVNFETVNASDEKAKIVTAALYLEAAVNIQFKFTANDLTGLKVVISDDAGVLQELTPNPSDKDTNGRYYVTFGNLNAGEMRKTVYATVMQGSKKVSNTMRYSIESYAASQSNSTVANLPELLHAMMRYGDSAKAFVGAK